MSFSRIAGVAGLAFVVLVVAGNVVVGSTSPPMGSVTGPEIVSYYAANAATLRVMGYLAPVIWITLPLFALGLRVRVGGGEQSGARAWATLGVAGAIMQNAIFSTVIASALVLTSLGAEAQPDLALSIWRWQRAAFGLNGTSLVLALGGMSLASLRGGVAPRWVSIGGLVGAAILLVSTALLPIEFGGSTIPPFGLVGFLLWLLFIAVSGVRLVSGPRAAAD